MKQHLFSNYLFIYFVGALYPDLWAILGNSHAHHSCVEKSCLGPLFPTFYEFGNFSDALMSDGFFYIFMEVHVTIMCPKYILTLHQN